MEKAKAAVPAAAYIVSTSGSEAKAAKTRLWSDLLKIVGAQVRSTTVLPRRDLLVKPADDGTFIASKAKERAGTPGVRQDNAK